MNLVRGYPRAAVIGLLTAGLISTAVTVAVLPARADEITVSQDNYRDGWDQNETTLDPASVTASDFGQQFATTLDGQVYAQPLIVGNILIAATENNKVYGLDKATGAIQWTRNDIGQAWPAASVGCSDLTPNIGITGTPVSDGSYVYFVAKVNDGVDALHPHYYMHAVDPASGTEKSGFPVVIGGHPTNDSTATFNPAHQGQRPGLLLLGGVVYAAFGSVCDYGTDWRGYVAGVSTAGVQTTLWSDETGSGIYGGGFWASGGGIVSDGSGQILLASGNGEKSVAPAPGPGNKPPGNLSESVIRLNVNADGSLTPTDFFSPTNAATLDANDTDLGSGGPMALPDGFDGIAKNVMVEMGKEGRLFLLDRNNLGGSGQGAGGTDNVLGSLTGFKGVWGHPAFFGGDGGYVYYTGNGGPLLAFKYGASGTGAPAITKVGASASTFPYTSGSPVVTSNGTNPGSAVVWVVYSGGPTGASAQLRAYAPEPDSTGTLALLWSGPISGTAVKFTTPATSGGRVYIGTRSATGTSGATDGQIIAYGRPATSLLTGSPVDFGNVAVGTTANNTLTVTAKTNLTITGVSATSPFGASMPTTTALASGASASIPVTFTPGAAGSISGTITVTTSSGTFPFSATGQGTKPGFSADPPNLTFTDEPVSMTSTQNIQITNTGTSTETINSVTAPAAPYSVTGLPPVGTNVPAGGSFMISVTYAPTAAGTNTDAITIGSSSDSNSHSLSIPLSGSAISAYENLTITPSPVDFGAVALGSTTTKSFTLTNNGNVTVTITKAKAPISDYTSASPLPEGQQIAPGQSYVQSVTLTPTKPGTDSDVYEVTADDGQGARFLPLTASVLPTLPAVPTSWQLNGTATLPAGTTGTVQLTAATAFQAGSAFSSLPVPTAGLAASFTSQIGGGNGADGLAFALIDATKNTPTSVGKNGGGLGLAGLNGIGVALDTFYSAQANSSNFVGIVTDNGSGTLTWLATAPVPTPLRTGSHNVTVTINAGAISVFVDGAMLINAYTPAAGVIPPNAYAGFTGGTGASYDAHTVSNVVIATASPTATATAPTATPASVAFQPLPTGYSELQSVSASNAVNAPLVITGITLPTGEFSASVLPAIGQVLPAGGSFFAHAGFAPTAAGPASGSLVVTTTGGTMTIPLTGSTWPTAGTLKAVH